MGLDYREVLRVGGLRFMRADSREGLRTDWAVVGDAGAVQLEVVRPELGWQPDPPERRDPITPYLPALVDSGIHAAIGSPLLPAADVEHDCPLLDGGCRFAPDGRLGEEILTGAGGRLEDEPIFDALTEVWRVVFR